MIANDGAPEQSHSFLVFEKLLLRQLCGLQMYQLTQTARYLTDAPETGAFTIWSVRQRSSIFQLAQDLLAAPASQLNSQAFVECNFPCAACRYHLYHSEIAQV